MDFVVTVYLQRVYKVTLERIQNYGYGFILQF